MKTSVSQCENMTSKFCVLLELTNTALHDCNANVYQHMLTAGSVIICFFKSLLCWSVIVIWKLLSMILVTVTECTCYWKWFWQRHIRHRFFLVVEIGTASTWAATRTSWKCLVRTNGFGFYRCIPGLLCDVLHCDGLTKI